MPPPAGLYGVGRWMCGVPASRPTTVLALDAGTVMAQNSVDEGSRSLGVDRTDVLRELGALRLEVAELRASRMRLVLAADADRRGLERALHETVQQLLVTLATDLELAVASANADPVAATSLFADMRSDVQLALEETRKLAERIYPPLLEAGGLGVALRSAAANLGVPIRLDVTLGGRSPSQIAALVYACCLDVFERVDGRTSTTVTVRADEEVVTFEIVAASVVTPGTPVRDRVEALGGRMTIQHEDRRTRVAGTLPLRS